jgi:hypothetical protein
MHEASARVVDFSRIWNQRFAQGTRSGHGHESLPGLHEIDDIVRQTHRIFDNLGYLREVVIAQQNAASEQRARNARSNQLEDDYSDEYKAGGGYVGGDAKKRRGVSRSFVNLDPYSN